MWFYHEGVLVAASLIFFFFYKLRRPKTSTGREKLNVLLLSIFSGTEKTRAFFLYYVVCARASKAQKRRLRRACLLYKSGTTSAPSPLIFNGPAKFFYPSELFSHELLISIWGSACLPRFLVVLERRLWCPRNVVFVQGDCGLDGVVRSCSSKGDARCL